MFYDKKNSSGERKSRERRGGMEGDRDKEEEDKIMLKALNFTGKKSYSADIFSMAKKKKIQISHISLKV